MNSTFARAAWLACALATATGASFAQTYPDHTLKLVVPYSPGGATDAQARLMSAELQKELGQTVVVENKPGASGNIGTELVARAPADGYTLLMGSIGPNSVTVSFSPPPRFDPAADFIPVALTAVSPNVLVVNPSFPANSLKELLEAARSQPGKLDYASPGIGTSNHLAMELLKQRGKVHIVGIPYKGSAPAMTDVMGGQVPMMFNNIDVVLPLVRAGKLKALAITGDKRSPLLPQVPTMTEAGMPNFATGAWFGLFVPAGTPAPIVAKLHETTQKILASAEVKQRFDALGIDAGKMSQSEFAAFVKDEIKRWAKLVKDAGLNAQ